MHVVTGIHISALKTKRKSHFETEQSCDNFVNTLPHRLACAIDGLKIKSNVYEATSFSKHDKRKIVLHESNAQFAHFP